MGKVKNRSDKGKVQNGIDEIRQTFNVIKDVNDIKNVSDLCEGMPESVNEKRLSRVHIVKWICSNERPLRRKLKTTGKNVSMLERLNVGVRV